MRDVAIYGAGGLGSLARDIFLQAGDCRPVVFLDSDPAKHGQFLDELPVLGDLESVPELLRRGVQSAFVAIGDNQARVRIAEELRRRGMRLASAIHPLASVSPTARLGEHVMLGARVTICVHAVIGAHAILSAGSIVEHDNQLGIGVHLQPAVRLAGTVVVEDFATLGIGASVIPSRRIGAGARVEPGSVVIADVPPGERAGGVPARVRTASRFEPDTAGMIDAAASRPRV